MDDVRYTEYMKKCNNIATGIGVALALTAGLGSAFSLAAPTAASAITKAQAQAQLKDLNSKYQTASTELDDLSAKLEATKGDIEKTESEIETKKNELEQNKANLENIIQSDYKGDKADSLLDVIMSSSSLDKIVANLAANSKIQQYKADTISSIATAKTELEQKNQELSAQKDEQQKQVDEANSKVNDLKSQQKKIQGIVSQFNAQERAELLRQNQAAARAVSDSNAASEGASTANRGPNANGNSILSSAQSLLGIPYVYGGNNPATGLDCTGYVIATYNRAGIAMPVSGRSTYSMIASAQAQGIWCTDRSQVRAGDIVFTSSHHAVIAASDGFGGMYHCPTPGRVSCYAAPYGFYGFVRTR